MAAVLSLPSPLISYFVVMIMELLASWVLLLSFVPTSRRRSESGLLNNPLFNSIWYTLEAKMKNDGFNHVNAWRTQLFREEPVRKRTSARWLGVVVVLQLSVCVENNVLYLEPFNDRQHLWEDNVPGVALNTNNTDSIPKSGLDLSKHWVETVREQGQLQLRTVQLNIQQPRQPVAWVTNSIFLLLMSWCFFSLSDRWPCVWSNPPPPPLSSLQSAAAKDAPAGLRLLGRRNRGPIILPIRLNSVFFGGKLLDCEELPPAQKRSLDSRIPGAARNK